jgi:HAD superfamily hydrolase (TIGR01509 family)
MLKALIFDMDGVIIDSEPLYQKANKNTFDKLGISISEEEYNGFVGTNGFYMWSTLKDKYKLNHSVEELIQMENDGFIEYLNQIENHQSIDGINELILDLDKNKIIMAIASSSIKRSINAVIDRLRLRKYFKEIVSGEDIKNGKPAPDIFLKASTLINTPPEECLVIEDSRNGVLATKSAGMKCIGYQNLNSGRQDLNQADYITSNLSELTYERLLTIFG